METLDNTGLGLIKASIERVQNQSSRFSGALKKLVNSSEEELTNFLKNGSAIVEPSNKLLRLLTTDENRPVIKATTGKNFLAQAKEVFKSGIDSDFKNWKLNKPSSSTPDTPASVYELVDDANFVQIFGSLSYDLDKLCLTQDQIIEFCVVHHSWLNQNGFATFFLFKENEHFFVAYVDVYSDGLSVRVYRLECDDVWNGRGRPRVVAPQL